MEQAHHTFAYLELAAADLETSKAFYSAAFGPAGTVLGVFQSR